MSRNTSVVIGNDEANFIRTQIKKGRFGSATEGVRAGPRLLEQQELKTETLRLAIVEGDASGPATPFSMDDYLAGKRAGR